MAVKKINLTQGYAALVDEKDYACLRAFKWCADVRLMKHGKALVYATRKASKDGVMQKIYMHRQIISGNLFGEGRFVIDHKDNDGLNNRRQNLCVTSQGLNLANTRKRVGTTSIYKGVSFHKETGRWRAAIWIDSKKRSLGLFGSEKDAAIAYNDAAHKVFGEYARLNEV